MPILEFLTAAMLVASAAVKIRSLRRSGLGIPPGPLLEFVVGAILLALLVLNLGRESGLPRWGVPAALLLLLLGSSIDHAARLARVRRRRIETEGGRLEAHVRYTSDSEDAS